MSVGRANAPELVRTIQRPDGSVGLSYSFHPKQARAWHSKKRVVAVIAGARAGKTVLGPLWLHREMLAKGPGDYLIVAPSYPLLDKAAQPEIQRFFGTLLGLGKMVGGRSSQFRFSEAGAKALWGVAPAQPARILFAHAANPEGLEAMSAKAAWLDEAGQAAFKLASYEAVQQRLSLDRGRCLITTKPFNLGWLHGKIYQPWEVAKKNGGDHPDIDCFNYGSADNPIFPPEELARVRATLPAWKYMMHYEGKFGRPAGLIYGDFDPATMIVDPFPVPDSWPRFGGLDFGGVNTAAVMAAKNPNPPGGHEEYIAYREYHQGGLTAEGHAKAMAAGQPKFRLWVGGSKSEGQWRMEFTKGGMHVLPPPISDVEVGIDRVRAMFKLGKLKIMRNCEHLIDELQTYSREVDEQGEPTEAIQDKAGYHRADALRYLCTRLHGGGEVRVGVL